MVAVSFGALADLHARYFTSFNFFSDSRGLTLDAMVLPFISQLRGRLIEIVFIHMYKHSVLSGRKDRLSSHFPLRLGSYFFLFTFAKWSFGNAHFPTYFPLA